MANFTHKGRSGDNWATPEWIYQKLNEEFHFNDDPCPLDPNGQGGLDREWGSSTYVNPPYSDVTPWVKKAWEESLKGKTIVMLLKGDSSTAWFHDWILGKAEIRYVRGRIHFNGAKPAPFCSIVVIYRGQVGT